LNENKATKEAPVVYNDVGFVAIFLAQLALVIGFGLSLGLGGIFNSNNPAEIFYDVQGEE